MASRQIWRDVEEAISREIRRITFWNQRTASRTVLMDTFNPFTGDLVQLPIEPNFYDSSADASNIQYPNFFVRLMKTREDRFTGRVVPQYGKDYLDPITTSPPALSIILRDNDGLVSSPGSVFQTANFQIRKVLPNFLLRLLSGNNIGTYLITSVTINNSGDHFINLSNILVPSTPLAYTDASTGLIKFTAPVDLNTVQVNDVFVDASSTHFVITAISPIDNTINIAPNSTPNLNVGGQIIRTGNVLKNTDSSVIYLILDPSQVVELNLEEGTKPGYDEISGVSHEVPIDVYYMVRIDSTDRDDHIDVINRMWEEFNPPRTALPTVIRSSTSAEQFLSQNVSIGGSNIVYISDTAGFNLDDEVVIVDDFHPTKTVQGDGFERPFQSVIASITPPAGNNAVVLGNQIIVSVDTTTDIITLKDYATGLPSNLTGITPGMQLVFDPLNPSALAIVPSTTTIYNTNQIQQGLSANSIVATIESVNIGLSQITVNDACGFQPNSFVNLNQVSYGILQLADTVPDTYLTSNHAKIISNTDFRLFMFHFVDHVTRDIEGSQYWVHEFSFWVQIWVDRLEQPQITPAVKIIDNSYGTLDGEISV